MLIKYVPNTLCLFRIFCVFPFIYFLIYKNNFGAMFTVLLGSISDFFDGYVARRYRVETKLGALLDPLADKIFANAVLWGMALWHQVSIPYWCIYLILAIALSFRDFILLLGTGFVLIKRIAVNLEPLYISKVCTMLVFVFITYSITFLGTRNQNFLSTFPFELNFSSFQHLLELLGLYLGYASIFMVIVTFIIYAMRFVKSIIKGDAEKGSAGF